MRVGRRLEAALVGGGAVLLTAVTNLDQVRGLTTTAPENFGDPLYFAWQLAWIGHALKTDPGRLWTTNAFLGASDNLAYTDTVLGYTPLSLLMPDGQSGALAQLNIAGLIANVLAIVGGYVLARALGARIPGALVAGAGFGFAPWRLTQVIHINVVSCGGIALTLALLCHGHGWSLRHGWRPERVRPGWAFAGWVAACWQLTFGFATGIWFAYMLALVMLAFGVGWLVTGRRRASLRRLARLLVADAAGGLVFLAVTWLLVMPYLRVLAAHPDSKRVAGMLELFSPPWFGLLTAPNSDLFWGGRQDAWRQVIESRWPPEMYMSPGIVLLALAVAGLFVSAWPLRRRLAIAAVTGVLVVLSMGTTFLGGGGLTYVPLYEHLPGWDSLRTPGRLMIWVTIGLSLLAAGVVTRVGDELARSRDRRRDPDRERDRRARERDRVTVLPVRAVAVGLAFALPAALVVGEGLNTTAHFEVPRAPIDLRTLPQPILLLPSELVGDYHMMLWSTEGWPVIANGDSGFDAASQAKLRVDVKDFPDAASLPVLRALGVATVVVIRSRVGPGSWAEAADKSVAGLDLTRTDRGDAVVFDVR